jgi:peptidyl-prolyl cis-trans isomerase C
MNYLLKGALLTLSIVILSGCQMKQPESWVAEVNGTYITNDEVESRIQGYPENMREQLKGNNNLIITQLINQELLYQEAQKQGFETQKNYMDQVKILEKQLAVAKQQLLTTLLIDDRVNKSLTVKPQEIHVFYNQNSDQFKAYQQRKARHILVKTGKEALKVYNQAIVKKDFASLAKKHSIDPTSERGGDLGWFRKGQLLPAFETAVFKLPQKGSISKIVKTKFGFHVIKLDDIKNVPAQKLDAVQAQIKQLLLNKKKSTALQGYLETIKKEHTITLKSEEDAKIPKKEVSQATTPK